MFRDLAADIVERRSRFPRGLLQPERGYRFSLDPLLLSCFIRPTKGQRGLDLGTGCGVLPLALLLRYGDRSFTISGIDISKEQIEIAKKNAKALHFLENPVFFLYDVKEYKTADESLFDFVVANPPYRTVISGRGCPVPARQTSRFEGEASLGDFVACAARCLRTRGRFGIVFLPERLVELMALLHEHGLEPKRLRMVHSRASGPARMVLMESVRGARPSLAVEAPLVLYEGEGNETRLTEEALEFCPFLASNAGGGSGAASGEDKDITPASGETGDGS